MNLDIAKFNINKFEMGARFFPASYRYTRRHGGPGSVTNAGEKEKKRNTITIITVILIDSITEGSR